MDNSTGTPTPETPMPVEAPAQQNPGRKKVIIVALVVLVVIIVALGATMMILSGIGKEYPKDLAVYTPADSMAFMQVDLRPVIDNRKEFSSAIDAWNTSKAIAKMREELTKALTQQGIDFEKDIQSWVGPVGAIALTKVPESLFSEMFSLSGLAMGGMGGMPSLGLGEKPKFVAILTTRDADEAERALAKIVKSDSGKVQSESYKGTELMRLEEAGMSEGLIYAIKEPLVVMSNDAEAVKATLDRIDGGGSSLVSSDVYKNAMKSASVTARPRVISVFANMQTLLKSFPKNMPKEMNPFNQPGMKYIDAVAGGLVITPTAIRMEGAAWGAKAGNDPLMKLNAKLAPAGGRAVEFLPKETVVAIAMQSPSSWWKIMAKQLDDAVKSAAPMMGETNWRASFKKETGLDLEADIIGSMTGELVLGAFDSKASGIPSVPLGISLVIEGKDAGTVKAKLAKIRNAVSTLLSKGSPGPILAWKPQKKGTLTFDTMAIPLMPVQFSLGQMGKMAIVSTGAGDIEKSADAGLDAGKSITSNETYQRVIKELPARPMSFVYVDLPGITRMVGAQMPPDDKQMMSAFGALAYGGSYVADGSRLVLYAEMDYTKLIKAMDKLSEKRFGVQ